MQALKMLFHLMPFALSIAFPNPKNNLLASENSTQKHTSIQSLLSEIAKDQASYSSANVKPKSLQPEPISQSYDALVNKAAQYFDAALYPQVIQIYEQIIQAIRVGEYTPANNTPNPSSLRYRLAQAHFLMQNYPAAIATLQGNANSTTEKQPKEYYLLGLAYRKRGEYENAIAAFEKYLSGEEGTPSSFNEAAQFELGLTYFLWEKPHNAKRHFKQLANKAHLNDGQQPLSSYLIRSLLYMARIDIAEGSFDVAEKNLEALKLLIAENDILRYELAYLLGEAFFQKEEFSKAADNFEQALPINQKNVAWSQETLYHLGWSHLKMADHSPNELATQRLHFEKAEAAFNKLLKQSKEERYFLALGQCYLTKANCLKDEQAYQQAEQILTRQDIFISREAQVHALLLRAAAAPTYSARDKLYRHLTQDAHRETPFYAKGWYLRGLNDFEEGQSLLKHPSLTTQDEANQAFERAISSMKNAFELLYSHEKEAAGLALKYQAQAAFEQKKPEKIIQALETLNLMLQAYPDTLEAQRNPDEIYYLHGLMASHLTKADSANLYVAMAENSLKQGLTKFPKGEFADKALYLLATLYYQQNELSKAETQFVRLATEYPHSPLAGDALFWASRSIESENSEKCKNYRRQVYELYPHSPFAAEAYFRIYSYHEYLQGDRIAIKHLHAMPEKYLNAPLTMNAWYLIGLDYKRDRKTAAGKWICKKNLNAAIDAFQAVESTFDTLTDKKLLAEEAMDYAVSVRYRAQLERGLSNLAVADEAQGAKRQIYLEYAEDVFRQINKDFKNMQHPMYPHLSASDACANIQEESTYWLAQTCLKANKDTAAEEVLTEMLEKYRSAKITRGYFLSRAWYDLGLIASCRKEYKVALQCYMHAEDAAKGKVLNTDQKLDLWIQQSLCQKALQEMDNAILLLSKVVNDDAVSGLRIKAMYLRAEIYESQGRHELARKQLESTSKKGGDWALKAKAKLDQVYGYH